MRHALREGRLVTGGQAIPTRAAPVALVVEASVVVLLDLEETLLALGTAQVLKAPTISKARSIIAAVRPDFAIVDYDIDAACGLAVANELYLKEIPFILVSGYGTDVDLPPHLRSATVLAKPISPGDLQIWIARQVGP